MNSGTITTVAAPDTITLNTEALGYTTASILAPHAAIQQIFWTDERINQKVTKEFIISKLRPDTKAKVFTHVSFGDDLTSCRYIDWILEKAKGFFLIMVEAGIPDKILGIIDDAWTDEDLPVNLKDVALLKLSGDKKQDEKLNRKFYNTQFRFLLRTLTSGSHINYGPNEVVPLEYLHKLPAAASLTTWQKSHLPEDPNMIYVKRKVPLGKDGSRDKDGEIDPEQESQFLTDVEKSRLVNHKHVAPVWASYTVKGCGFTLTTFDAEHTLKSFIDFRVPGSFTKLNKAERARIIMTWFHCLADALVAIHEAGMAHEAIMPSNIVIDAKNQVAFCDIGSLASFQNDKKIDSTEVYNYGAPEDYLEFRRAFISEYPSGTKLPRFTARRGTSFDSYSGPTVSKSKDRFTSSHQSTASISSDFVPPGLVASSKAGDSPSSSEPSIDSPKTPTLEHTVEIYNFTPSRPAPPIPSKAAEILNGTSAVGGDAFRPLVPIRTTWTSTADNNNSSPESSPKIPSPTNRLANSANSVQNARQADIFSLGCVFMDMLTYLLRKKAGDFVKHRSTKRKIDLSQPSLQLDRASTFSSSSTSLLLHQQPSRAATFAAAASSSGYSPSNFADASFHANREKLESWMQILEQDAEVQEDPQFKAFPSLLRVTRAMLTQNAQLRPTAMDVRERLLDALVTHARVEGICCKGFLTENLAPIPDKSHGLSVNRAVHAVLPQVHMPHSLPSVNLNHTSVLSKAKSLLSLGKSKKDEEPSQISEKPKKMKTKKSKKDLNKDVKELHESPDSFKSWDFKETFGRPGPISAPRVPIPQARPKTAHGCETAPPTWEQFGSQQPWIPQHRKNASLASMPSVTPLHRKNASQASLSSMIPQHRKNSSQASLSSMTPHHRKNSSQASLSSMTPHHRKNSSQASLSNMTTMVSAPKPEPSTIPTTTFIPPPRKSSFRNRHHVPDLTIKASNNASPLGREAVPERPKTSNGLSPTSSSVQPLLTEIPPSRARASSATRRPSSSTSFMALDKSLPKLPATCTLEAAVKEISPLLLLMPEPLDIKNRDETIPEEFKSAEDKTTEVMPVEVIPTEVMPTEIIPAEVQSLKVKPVRPPMPASLPTLSSAVFVPPRKKVAAASSSAPQISDVSSWSSTNLFKEKPKTKSPTKKSSKPKSTSSTTVNPATSQSHIITQQVQSKPNRPAIPTLGNLTQKKSMPELRSSLLISRFEISNLPPPPKPRFTQDEPSDAHVGAALLAQRKPSLSSLNGEFTGLLNRTPSVPDLSRAILDNLPPPPPVPADSMTHYHSRFSVSPVEETHRINSISSSIRNGRTSNTPIVHRLKSILSRSSSNRKFFTLEPDSDDAATTYEFPSVKLGFDPMETSSPGTVVASTNSVYRPASSVFGDDGEIRVLGAGGIGRVSGFEGLRIVLDTD